MQGKALPKIISCATICLGALVFAGWLLDISVLKSIIPNAVTMKFSTAVSFIFSGIIIYFIAKYNEGKTGIAQIAIPVSSFVIVLFMATLLFAYVFSITSGIEQLFVREEHDAIKTPIPGSPSLLTMASFILLIVASIFALSETRLRKYVTYIGYVISTIGLVAIVGYVTNQPTLYYYIHNVSTGMAILTSILFVGLGIALILLGNNEKIQRNKSVKIQTKIISLFLAVSLIPIIFVVGLNFNIVEDSPNSESIKLSMLLIGIVTAIIVTVFSLFIAKSISKPIITLKNTALQISEGNLTIKANETEGDEVGDLSKVFNQMLDNVTKSERLSIVGLLSSTLGHDIKNNLTAMKVTLDLLRQKHQSQLDEDISAKITILEGSVNNMKDQIDGVLDFVRQTPLKLENASFMKLLENVLKTIKVPESIKVDAPLGDIQINCDTRKLEVVLANLIENSIQAIETDGKITIKAVEDADYSIIQIEDSGPGIPPEIISKIFEPLFTTKRTGTGLGLSSCANIVKEHGGNITVMTSPTTFTIKMPKFLQKSP